MFRISLLGSSGVGKSAFLIRHLEGDFHNNLDTIVNVVTFSSNYGPISFECTENQVTPDMVGVIVMFSKIKYDTFTDAKAIIDTISEDIPIILVCNKTDIPSPSVISHDDMFAIISSQANICVYPISVKSCYNFEKPFLDLARQLTGHPDLCFV